MKTRIAFQNPLTKLSGVALLLSLFLLLPMLACSISLPEDKDSKETKISRNVQSTLNSEKVMTLEAQQTSDANAAQQTPADVGGIVQTQQATIDAQNTSIAATETPVSVQTAPSTEQPTTSSESTPISITEWKGDNWALYSACKLTTTSCWKISKMGALVSEKSFYIDPNWNQPYLVFWHMGISTKKISRQWFNPYTKPGALVGVDGKWTLVRDYSDTMGGTWARAYVNLGTFKGKEISIQFFLDTNTSSTWYIQDVQILPDFTPP